MPLFIMADRPSRKRLTWASIYDSTGSMIEHRIEKRVAGELRDLSDQAVAKNSPP